MVERRAGLLMLVTWLFALQLATRGAAATGSSLERSLDQEVSPPERMTNRELLLLSHLESSEVSPSERDDVIQPLTDRRLLDRVKNFMKRAGDPPTPGRTRRPRTRSRRDRRERRDASVGVTGSGEPKKFMKRAGDPPTPGRTRRPRTRTRRDRRERRSRPKGRLLLEEPKKFMKRAGDPPTPGRTRRERRERPEDPPRTRRERRGF